MDLKLVFTAGLLLLVLSGCMNSRIGKVPVVDGKLPPFFEVGRTTPAEVLDRFGEPLEYREYEGRSVMIYEYIVWVGALVPFEWGDYRIFLVFEDRVLKKTEVQRLKWTFEPGFITEQPH